MTSAAVVSGPPVPVRVALGAAPAVLAPQPLAVRPVLDRRSDRVPAGETPPRSHAHLVHVVLEVVKAVALAVLGVTAPSGL
jgi:hypothetical protein